MADGDENAFDSDFFSAAVIVLQACTSNAAFVAQDFINRAVELEDDFAFFDPLHQLVHHDFLGTEAVAAVNQGNGVGDIGKVEGFFYCSIATADYGNILFFIEETIASCAGGNAFAGKGFFAWQT